MGLEELQSWILSPDGLGEELSLVSRYAAAKSIGGLSTTDADLKEHRPDWRRLLFAGSILSVSPAPRANEFALAVAQAGLLYSGNERIADASATVLTQLAKHRAVQLALDREHLHEGLDERVGASEQMLLARRELQQSVFPAKGRTIVTNRIQREFWDELERASWVSASAPTASGKTYLVLRWLLNEFATNRAKLAVFLAPTRALVGEIERELLEVSPRQVAMARLIDAAVAPQPDGPVVSIPDADALGESTRAAVAAGMPVVSMDSGLDVSKELGELLHMGIDEYPSATPPARR